MAEDDPTLEEMYAQIKANLSTLENNLPKRIDPLALSRTKLPFKVLNYRDALIWRVAELGRAALQTFEAQQFAAAIVLVRATVESNAALWYLNEKVQAALKKKKLGDLDDCVNRLLSGTYTWEDFPPPIRVKKFLESVERSLPGFKEQYSRLSEYAHPNAGGTVGLYSTIDFENTFVDFGPHERNINPAKVIFTVNLNVALMLFVRTYDYIADAMPEFVKLCEREIPPPEMSTKIQGLA